MVLKIQERKLKPIVKKENRKVVNTKRDVPQKIIFQEQNALGNRAIEQQALKEKDSSEKKAKVIETTSLKVKKEDEPQELNAVVKEESVGKSEIIKTPTDPSEDKAFQRTLRYIKRSGNIQKEPEDTEKKLKEINNASRLNVSEQQKNNNQKAHQKAIKKKSEKKETSEHKFTAQSFKDTLKKNLTILENKLPHSEKGAKNFKKKKPLETLKKGISKDVGNQKVKLVGPLETEAKKENITNVDGAKIVTIEDAPKSIPKVVVGVAPKSINSSASIPKVKHPSEISMEKESQSLDDTMEENNLTETQLANSNEPTFIEALDSKTKAQTEAKQAPLTYRIEENSRLITAKKDAAVSGKQGLSAMFKSRSDNFEKVHSRQTSTQAKNIKKKREINKKFETIYNLTKKAVTIRLDKITTDVDKFFEENGKIGKAKKIFENNVEDKLDDIYGWSTIDDKIISFVVGRDINADDIDQVFISEKKLFIKTLNTTFDEIATLIATGLNNAMTLINAGQVLTELFYKSLSKDEQKLADDSLEIFNDRYKSLKETVTAKEKELAQSLAKKYKENIDGLKETFDSIKKKVSAGWIEGAINAIKGVIATIKKLRDLVSSLLSEIKAYLPVIMNDPIAFVKQLFRGIGAGIELFKENIKKHVLGGFVKWLTGSMGSMSINIPDDLFSLKGIFSLVMQILGLGWDYLRKKAVKFFGEPIVKAMESSVKIFKILRSKGIAGIWEYLKEQFNDLKKTIIDEIQSMLITQVLIAGVKWLVSLLIPGAGFIKAIMAIKDLIVFFIESAIMLIPALISSIKALASGAVKGVAKAIEKGLGLLIVLVINLFAKLIGLGGLAKKVMKIIKRIRNRIDKAIDKLIYKAKKAFKSLVKKGKGRSKGKSKKGKIDKDLGAKLTFSAGKEKHKLWITNVGDKVKVMVASDNPGVIEKRLKSWEGKLTTLDKENQTKAKVAIGKARALTSKTMTEAKEEAIITKAILKDKDITPDEVKKESKAEKETIAKEEALKKVLMILFDVFGEFIDFEEKIQNLSIKAIVEVMSENKTVWEKYKNDKEKDDKYISGYTKEEFLKYRKHNIKETIRPLLIQYRSDAKESPLVEALKEYFKKSISKKSKPTHNEFNPNAIKLIEKGDTYIVSYDNKRADGTKGSHFEIDIKFGKITKGLPNVNERRVVKGKGLISKPTDIGRGKWDSAGYGFDNAHIIGDQFGGAGKNYGLNIYPSSPNYNRVHMANIENKMAKFFRENIKENRNSYNLTVTAYLSHESKDKTKLQNIMEEEFKKDNSVNKNEKELMLTVKNGLIKKLQIEIVKDLKNLPAKFEQVQYKSISVSNLQNKNICNRDDGDLKKEEECIKNITKALLVEKGFHITLGEDQAFEDVKKKFPITS